MDFVSIALAVGAAISAHSAEILAVCYALINLFQALAKGPEAKSKLSALADFLAIVTRKDAKGSLKAPLLMRSKPLDAAADAPAPKSPPDLKALVLLPLAFLAFLPGCAFCKDAANAAAPRCVLEQNMIKCGESSGFALVPIVLGLIAGAIAGQPFDASALESQLISQGVKDVPCVLAALEDYIGGSALAKAGDPASLLLQQEVHAALLDSLVKKGMHGSLRLQLRSGHAVDVEVP